MSLNENSSVVVVVVLGTVAGVAVEFVWIGLGEVVAAVVPAVGVNILLVVVGVAVLVAVVDRAGGGN